MEPPVLFPIPIIYDQPDISWSVLKGAWFVRCFQVALYAFDKSNAASTVLGGLWLRPRAIWALYASRVGAWAGSGGV